MRPDTDPRALAPCDDCGVPAGRDCVPTCPTRREPDVCPRCGGNPCECPTEASL